MSRLCPRVQAAAGCAPIRPATFAALAVFAAWAVACRDHRTVEAFPASFAGVGIELHSDGSTPRVVRVLADGPAERAGVQPGDDVVAIDGESTKGRSLGDVVMALRGAPDSQVELTVERGSERIIFVLRRLSMAKERGDYRAAERGVKAL